jgi:hypothetical protein
MPAAHAYKIEFDRRLTPTVRTVRAPRHRGRAVRRKTAFTARLIAIAVVPLVALFVYVGLTAELAAQTYRLNADQTLATQLEQTDDNLHQRLAQLQSVARLEAAAAALHMREPSHVAVITLPPASTKPTTTALAAGIAGFKRLFSLR